MSTALTALMKSLPSSHSDYSRMPKNYKTLHRIGGAFNRIIGEDAKGNYFIAQEDHRGWYCVTPPLSPDQINAVVLSVLQGEDDRILTWAPTLRVVALAAYVLSAEEALE